jgi:ABC-type antimicrobial peptide transport system permease subunit
VIYKTELHLKRASAIGSVLILIIMLTGVLGLVSLSVGKRNKEIGIRKVLGASAPDILILMSREYIILMLVAILAGVPLSYLFSAQWLTNFAYRIDAGIWTFVIPGLLLFCITVLAIWAQSFRTSVSNPVNSLRYE